MSTAASPIKITGLAPLFQVFDMQASIAFYCDILGFEIVSSSAPTSEHFDWAWLRLGDSELMLNTAYEKDQRPPIPDHSRLASHEDAALFFACSNIEETYRYLKSKGVKAEKPVITPYGMKQLYIKAPDGYVLCFQWPEG